MFITNGYNEIICTAEPMTRSQVYISSAHEPVFMLYLIS
jgi:hypothetical protein